MSSCELIGDNQKTPYLKTFSIKIEFEDYTDKDVKEIIEYLKKGDYWMVELANIIERK